MTIAQLRSLLAKANEPSPTEYREDCGDDMIAMHMTERGKALYCLPHEAARALPALLDIADELRKTIGEPQPVPETVMEGPNVVEHYMGEMVCVHCGQHGNAAYNIEHEADCTYVSGTAALAKLETP
jgi:hypothetical protein